LKAALHPRVFASLALERRSVRSFDGRAVEDDIVIELIGIAGWSPSPHNSQPWRFTLLSDGTKGALAESMAARLAEDLHQVGVPREEIDRQVSKSRSRINAAPTAVLVSIVPDGLKLSGDPRTDELEVQMAVQSVGAVLQTLFLAAWERGIGSCWMAAPLYCQDVVRGALDLPPDCSPQALVIMGYPAGEGRVRPRRPLNEIVHRR
jgi:F420 biosynthesis protein FbiB-like protein